MEDGGFMGRLSNTNWEFLHEDFVAKEKEVGLKFSIFDEHHLTPLVNTAKIDFL